MAWAIIPAPGTRLGPCLDACAHRDCARSRADAAHPCCHCQAPIGYETKYTGSNEGMAHFMCELEAVEREQEAQRPASAARAAIPRG